MSSHKSSSTDATPTGNKGSTQELLNDQLSDWWMTTVLGADTGFVTEDSESTLGWEFAMEEDPIDEVVETRSKQSGESFVNTPSSHERSKKVSCE